MWWPLLWEVRDAWHSVRMDVGEDLRVGGLDEVCEEWKGKE